VFICVHLWLFLFGSEIPKDFGMLAWLKRQRIQWEDWLRYSPLVRNVMSRMFLLRTRWKKPASDQERARIIRQLASAARLAAPGADGPTSLVRTAMARIHGHLALLNPAALDWSEFNPKVGETQMRTSALLKAPLGEREKGVLYIAFEREWVKLLHHCDPRELARRYAVVVGPSSDPHNLINYVFPVAFPGILFTLISHAEEIDLLPAISPNYTVVPLYASSWVNPQRFQPLPRSQRDIDLIMVANFAKFKRQFALFGALRQLPRQLRVLLIGQDQDGRTAETIRDEARCYGVADRFDVLSHQPNDEVARCLCRARTSVILTRREGSCVVVAESLFADTPVALLEKAEVGSRAFINPSTGRLLREDRPLGPQLGEFLASTEQYHPRQWAQEHITCSRSSQILNDAVKKRMLALDQEWTQDLAEMTRCPDSRLVKREDRLRLQPAYEDLKKRFGLDLSPALGN
jgi:glycosyltransferase involved in cell wall biosynthesis